MADQTMKKRMREQYKSREIIGGVYCIKCREANAFWMRATTDMQGSKNRFAFSSATNSCVELCMAQMWKQYGASAFSFEVIEELKKSETQTDADFAADVNILLALWNEKLTSDQKEI